MATAREDEHHGRRATGGRRWRRVVLLAVATVAPLLTTVTGPSPAEASTTGLRGEILVDDVGGHVFVAIDDTVVVRDLGGAQVGLITEQYGASDLLLRGRDLYVIAADVSRINRVDADRLAVVGGWSVEGAPDPTSMAWSNGKIWFTYAAGTAGERIASLDPATGTVVTGQGKGTGRGADIVGYDSPARIFTLDRGGSAIRSYDTGTGALTLLATSPYGGCDNGSELAGSLDASRIWTACGAPYKFNEYNGATLTAPAVNYPADTYPTAVSRSGDGRIIVGGTYSHYDEDIWLYEAGKPVAIRTLEIGAEDLQDGMVATSVDGGLVYAQSTDGVFHRWNVAPKPTAVGPSTVPVGSGAALTVTGTDLGLVKTATVGGLAAAVTLVSASQVRLTLPAVPIGTQRVVLTGTLGSGATEVTVVPALPSAPVGLTVTGRPTRAISLSWTAPSPGSAPITSYRVTAYAGTSPTPLSQTTVSGTSATLGGLTSGSSYVVRVAATSSYGTGPESVSTPSTVAGYPDMGPFTTLGAFVDRLHRDLLGRAPTSAERSSAVATIASGQLTPAGWVASLRTGPDGTGAVDPVVRIYGAAFLRTPDVGGLSYWIGKKRKGTRLSDIAESFTRSSEFTTRYGKLSNAAFVAKVYENILGRPADPSGTAYWVKHLDARTKTRGQVLSGLTQSAGYIASQAAEVEVSVLYLAMLGKAPTATQRDGAVAAIDAGGTKAQLFEQLLASAAYAARVAG